MRCLEDVHEWAFDEEALLADLSVAADPDLALLTLARLYDAADPGVRSALLDGALRARMVRLLGVSHALGDHLVKAPADWTYVDAAQLTPAAAVADLMVSAVDGLTGDEAADVLKREYRRQLLRIATVDIMSEPYEVFPLVAESLADLADATLQAALRIAVQETPDAAALTRLAVIGMGKCGGRELNYISDVDVIFAAEPADGADEADSNRAATRLATRLMQICSSSTAEGSIWQVDAALRPEGKQGPLVRTVASHLAYYERWAKTWEFQALLKARPVAGNAGVAEAYLAAVQPLVWQASKRPGFVEDVQSMRRRVEKHIPSAESARQLKLGPGGLRDVEFSMQLLQLVHGRTDEQLRLRGTLSAVEGLTRGGYIGRDAGHQLDEAYRVLRVLEHRIQLEKLRRTHLMPTSQDELRRLGRSIGLRVDPAVAVVKLQQDTARVVRRLHERIFYRPLLSAVARLDDSDARLSAESAEDRLAALGFRNPAGALNHLSALMTGVSRRALIQRTLLPVMLQWFAEEADPDQGLLAFRKISESLGASHWYLKMLRDEGTSAETLARALAASRFVADLLERAPSAVQLFGSADQWRPRSGADLQAELRSLVSRQTDPDEAVQVIRGARRHELIRLAIAQLTHTSTLDELQAGISDLSAAVVDAALYIATRRLEIERDRPAAARLAVIGMGRLGGRECGFASDADVIFVHEPVGDDPDEQEAQRDAEVIIADLRRSLAGTGPDPALPVDADLRPEGKSGPISRTLESYAAYYARWSEGWEAQALLRAAPVAGDEQLGSRFIELVDPLRYPAAGISTAAVRRIRTLKARMEAERIPRGADVRRHFKLGRGGLSDVEWTVQLAQLEHAHAIPALRRTDTMATLRVMVEHDLIPDKDAQALAAAWSLASQMRNASVLWRGRAVEALPSDMTDAAGIARILGWEAGTGGQLNEYYLRVARRARAVMERDFYGSQPEDGWDPHPSGR